MLSKILLKLGKWSPSPKSLLLSPHQKLGLLPRTAEREACCAICEEHGDCRGASGFALVFADLGQTPRSW